MHAASSKQQLVSVLESAKVCHGDNYASVLAFRIKLTAQVHQVVEDWHCYLLIVLSLEKQGVFGACKGKD